MSSMAERTTAQDTARKALNEIYWETPRQLIDAIAKAIEASRLSGAEEMTRFTTPRPLDDWHEDFGDALWWFFPVQEAPYAGSPLDTNWPGYHTHWTPIPMPALPLQSGSGEDTPQDGRSPPDGGSGSSPSVEPASGLDASHSIPNARRAP